MLIEHCYQSAAGLHKLFRFQTAVFSMCALRYFYMGYAIYFFSSLLHFLNTIPLGVQDIV